MSNSLDALRQPTVDGRLQNMSPGVDVNDALFRTVGSRLWNGIPMEDVVAEMVDAAIAKAPSPDWTREAQRLEIEDMCLRTVLKDPKLSSRPPRPSVRRSAAYASSFTTADDYTHARRHTSLPAAVDAELPWCATRVRRSSWSS